MIEIVRVAPDGWRLWRAATGRIDGMDARCAADVETGPAERANDGAGLLEFAKLNWGSRGRGVGDEAVRQVLVHVVDLTPRHVEQVKHDLGSLGVTAEVGDARQLSQDDESFDIVLLLGLCTTSPIAPKGNKPFGRRGAVVCSSGVIPLSFGTHVP